MGSVVVSDFFELFKSHKIIIASFIRYRYQEWLQQERYFEHLERNMMRRRRKRIPIQQRLN
jgi:hypothetical protein